MFNKTIVILLVLSFSHLFAQNSTPRVKHVTFTQRTDGTFMVDIYYDLYEADGRAMTITMKVSSNNGSTWDFSCTNIIGDVGESLLSGVGKHIIWNFGVEHPEEYGEQFRIKIIADSGPAENSCPGIPSVDYAGKIYNTVQIGEQCWIKENLNIGEQINGIEESTNNGVIEKYCFENNEPNCGYYGGLYLWQEAMQYTTLEGAQGICPAGWHIPTIDEFETLNNSVNGSSNALKEVGYGQFSGSGTNTSGFSALLAGLRGNIPPTYGFFAVGALAEFWSSNGNEDNATRIELRADDDKIYFFTSYNDYGLSIRCIKN